MTRHIAHWCLGFLLVNATCWFTAGERDANLTSSSPDQAPPVTASQPAPRNANDDEIVRWIALGGGASPELNQIQLEQDLALATEILQGLGPGRLLFAGGPGSQAVQVLREDAPPTTFSALGELFAPNAARETRYRATSLRPDASADRDTFLQTLRASLSDDNTPLTIYWAAHGTLGDTPQENSVLMWGEDGISAQELAKVLDATPRARPTRLILTSCYGGGFANLAFRDANPANGPSAHPRCGFFATTADRPSSGCDPNPERSEQEGYGIHFLQALRGRDRHGASLPLADLDRNDDGVISLLEAHTRARIASRSLDIPTLTSERYLEEFVPIDSPVIEAQLRFFPEERSVIEALRRELDLDTPEEALARSATLNGQLDALEQEMASIEAHLERAETQLRMALWHRFPALSDPWHPDFQDSYRSAEDEVAEMLATHPASEDIARLRQERLRVSIRYDDTLVESAPLERLQRAAQTLRLATWLRNQGGPYWQHYRTFLDCERAPL